MITLISDELLTICGNFCEFFDLRETGTDVMNVSSVTTPYLDSFNKDSSLAVMTDNGHPNPSLVGHVTVNGKRIFA